MRKYGDRMKLQYRSVHPAASRNAFSLTELVVAVGILSLMLALAGQVFSISARSTSQATAVMDTAQAVRQLEAQLREDLRNVSPQDSVMVIESTNVRAYWTKAGRDADTLTNNAKNPADGYPRIDDPEHEIGFFDPGGKALNDDPVLTGDQGQPALPRGDQLMIFTANKAQSRIHPGVLAEAQQVVYGHAVLSEFNNEGEAEPLAGLDDAYAGKASTLLPASQWHLARRQVLLTQADLDLSTFADNTLEADALDVDADVAIPKLESAAVLSGLADIVEGFRYQDWVVGLDVNSSAGGQAGYAPYLPPVLSLLDSPRPKRTRFDETPPVRYADSLGTSLLPGCASFKIEWCLNPRSEYVDGRLDHATEVYWIDMGRYNPSTCQPYTQVENGPFHSFFEAERRLVQQAEQQEDPNLEFVLLQQADGLRKLVTGSDFLEGSTALSLEDRFQDCNNYDVSGDCPPFDGCADARRGPPNLAVFKPLTRRFRDRSDDLSPDPIFPAALRITIDVYDAQQRVDPPQRHVMVIPVGS